MKNISVTAELLDGVERRTAYELAGLEVPDDGTTYKANFDGTTTVSRKPPVLPSGRALLAQLLQEGRPVDGRWVQIAKEAAIAEALTDLRAHHGPTRPRRGAGNKAGGKSVTYGPPSEADKAAWRWYEIDRSQRIGAAIVAKYDLDPDLLRALKDAHEDDDSGVALDELLDIAEAAIEKRDEGAE
jgi:hypothetical protein